MVRLREVSCAGRDVGRPDDHRNGHRSVVDLHRLSDQCGAVDDDLDSEGLLRGPADPDGRTGRHRPARSLVSIAYRN